MKKERSRAYPLLDLEKAVGLLLDPLSNLGMAALDRRALAERLGYHSSGDGGIAARKIAALVHFGLLKRGLGLYRLSQLGQSLLVLPPQSSEHKGILGSVLAQPVLFKRILDRYRPFGRIPEDLASVLVDEHGITGRASGDAAEVFRQSARFAGVLKEDDTFVASPSSSVARQSGIAGQAQSGDAVAGEAEVRRLQILLPNMRSAYLEIPAGIDQGDFDALVGGLNSLLQVLPAHAGIATPASGRVLRANFRGRPQERDPNRSAS